MKRLPTYVLFLCAAVATSACKKDEAKPAAIDPAAKPAAEPAAAAAKKDTCISPVTPGGPKQTVTINGATYERDGYKLTRTTSDPDDSIVLGIISDVKEETEENLRNVKAALEYFTENKAEIVVFLGDSSETQAGVTKVLKALSASPLPVFAIIGNRECRTHWVEGMKEAQKDAPNLFDFTQIRLFNSDDVSIISLPGYYNPTYLHCTDGCRYFPADVEGLKPLLGEASGTPFLISHGPPRQDGAQGLDRIHDNANVGDPALAEFLTKNPVSFGAFANIGEAGGKAVDSSGKTVVPQDTLVNSLYVNPGFTDAVQWQMLDGTTSEGMVALVTVKGKQASYKIKRFGAAAAAPKK